MSASKMPATRWREDDECGGGRGIPQRVVHRAGNSTSGMA